MKLFRGVTVLSLILAAVPVLGACDLLKKKTGDDAGADGATAAAEDAGAAPTPTPAAGLAANEDDIARFPDETKLENVAATAKRQYNVRDAPPAGAIVAGLSNGQAVTQIASRQKYFLITFDDAKQGKKLMGWVHGDAFLAAPAENTVVEPKCATGEVALMGDTPFCGKICDKDADCPSGQACKGSAAKWNKGKAGDSVTVCTVFHAHDAGAAPPAQDAGGGLKLVTTLDAGQAPVVVDAGGGAKPIPTPTTDIVPAVDGKCAPGFVVVKKDGKCHKLCPKPADCRAAFFCGKCDGQNTCNDVRNFCPN